MKLVALALVALAGSAHADAKADVEAAIRAHAKSFGKDPIVNMAKAGLVFLDGDEQKPDTAGSFGNNLLMNFATTDGGGITFGGGLFEVELQGLTAGTQYDQVLVTAGSITLGAGVATLSLLPSGYTPTITDSFVVINNTGAGTLTGTFAGLPDQSIVASNVLGSGIDYLIYYGTYSGFPTSVVIAPVPEPATVLALCAAGAGAVGLIRRRRKANQIAA